LIMRNSKMDNTKLDFENRKSEIENYFKFLMIFDDDETRLQFKDRGIIVTEKIQSQFQITLIANAFIILYNLIEATVRNSIIEIYDKLKEEEVCYEKLSESLKKIWIKQSTDNLKEGNYRPETLREYVFNITTDILNKETIIFSKDKMDFSGNLDAQKIRKLADKFGFETSPNGRNLVEITNKRNRLAHGEQTFYEVGKDFSVKELEVFKNETILYLEDVIYKIEKFISAKEYAAI
jgi:hypothetical protein